MEIHPAGMGIPSSAVIFDNNTYHVVYHSDCGCEGRNITPISSDKQIHYVNGENAWANDNDRAKIIY